MSLRLRIRGLGSTVFMFMIKGSGFRISISECRVPGLPPAARQGEPKTPPVSPRPGAWLGVFGVQHKYVGQKNGS